MSDEQRHLAADFRNLDNLDKVELSTSLRHYGTMAPRHYGTMALRHYDTMSLRNTGSTSGYYWVPVGTSGYHEYQEDQDQISCATYTSDVVFCFLSGQQAIGGPQLKSELLPYEESELKGDHK